MRQKLTSSVIAALVAVLTIALAGCGAPERAPEPAQPIATEPTVDATPTPIPPTPTVVPPTNTPQPPPPTPTATPPTPSILISLASNVPDWAAGKMELKVSKGGYQLQSGATLQAGSQVYVTEDVLKYPAGLMIDVGDGGITLGGNSYRQGSKLYVFEEGKLKKVN